VLLATGAALLPGRIWEQKRHTALILCTLESNDTASKLRERAGLLGMYSLT